MTVNLIKIDKHLAVLYEISFYVLIIDESASSTNVNKDYLILVLPIIDFLPLIIDFLKLSILDFPLIVFVSSICFLFLEGYSGIFC